MEKQTGQQNFIEFLMAAHKLKMKAERAQKKFFDTHTLIERVQAPYVNNEKRLRRGQPPLNLAPHTRQIVVEGEVKRQLILVDRTRFTGWDYGKKYTGERLRQLRKERNAA